MADDLRLDLEELKHLETIAKRPRVLSVLSSEIQNLDAKVPPTSLLVRVLMTNENDLCFVMRSFDFCCCCDYWKQIAKASAAAAAPAPVPVAHPPAVSSVLNYVPLDKFSWEQDGDKIKVRFYNSLFACFWVKGRGWDWSEWELLRRRAFKIFRYGSSPISCRDMISIFYPYRMMIVVL